MASASAELDPRHVKVALRIARGFIRRLPRSVQAGDIEQAAMLGVIDAVRRRPNQSGPAFDWYVCRRIRGEILDELRRQDWASRRRRAGPAPPVIVRFEDIDERWEELFEGASTSPEAAAVVKCDADKAWTTPLPTRARRIMTARFERGHRSLDIAHEEGVSEPRVSQLTERALHAMKSHLTGSRPSRDVPLAERVQIWQARIEGGKR